MSPTPATFASPIKPVLVVVGGHERGDRGALRRAGRAGRPVRHEHLPDAAATGRGSCWPRDEFEVPVSEYPPSDYARLVEAAAARYGVAREELLVGAGADEILDLVAKAFLPPGGAAVLPVPDVRHVRGADRAARRERRAGPASRVDRTEGSRSMSARSARPPRNAVPGLAVQPEQPDRRGRAGGTRRRAARRAARGCASGRPRMPPRSSSTRRTSRSPGTRCSRSASSTRA